MRPLTLAVTLFLFGWSPAFSQGVPEPVHRYKLAGSSRFETGCFTMCDCAIRSQPMTGTFGLALETRGPLFDEYRVLDVRWLAQDPTIAPTITGSGTYRVGGEFAVQHQMVLDLSLDGGPLQRFDSGLLATTNHFPLIEIRIPLHGDSACVDTVLLVHASPATGTDVESAPSSGVLTLRTLGSPVHDAAELALGVGGPRTVAIEVLDVHGRVVRQWSRTGLMPGVHRVTWDGRTASGTEASTGLYLVRARQGGRSVVARVILIR